MQPLTFQGVPIIPDPPSVWQRLCQEIDRRYGNVPGFKPMQDMQHYVYRDKRVQDMTH